MLHSYRSLVEERNDENNNDDPPDCDVHSCCLTSDDRNKEVFRNSTSCGLDWSKKQCVDFKGSNNFCYDNIIQCLLICYQLVCCQQQACSGITTHKNTVSSMVTVFLMLTISIQQWKELCSIVVVQYCREVLCALICNLEELLYGGIQQGKELTCRCYQSLCNAPTLSKVLQHYDIDDSDLSHASPLPVTNVSSLDDLYDYAVLYVVMFGDHLLDAMFILCDVPVRLSPVLALGLFPHRYHQLYHFKSCNDVGRQASDKNGGNGKRSQSESSKPSGSAGSNADSSTTGSTGHTGRIGLTGGAGGNSSGSSGGDDDDDNNSWSQDRKPWDLTWEENGDEDDNEDCSTPENNPDDAAPKNTSEHKKTAKASSKMAKPIVYEYRVECGKDLYMQKYTSPMMNDPVLEDKSGDESTDADFTANDDTIPIDCQFESFNDKLLYSRDIPRTFKNFQMLCLPCNCCRPSRNTEAVSLTSLLPPPGGGSDKQFKDVLIVFCTFMAAVYCYLYDDRCYFGSDDFCVDNIFVMMDVKTGKIASVSVHALLHQLDGVDIEPIRAATNEGLRSLAGSIYSQYQHTQQKDLADGVLAMMRRDQSDLDMLHSLLVYHDNCQPFNNNVIAFVH